MKAVLIRLQNDLNQTLGILQFFDQENKLLECKTMELPWRDNQRNVSCIPSGTYQVRKHVSPKFGETFHVLDVPGRSEILIHTGNYNRDTLGCILPGAKFADINGDGLKDVTSSAITMKKLLATAPNEFKLTIV